MTKLGLALFLALGLAPAQAQVNFTLPPPAGVVVGGVMVVTTCGAVNLANGSIAFLAMDHTGALCTNASGGGGGGGLSVTDQTTWIQGTSAFTPNGGVFNDTATLSSGQEGTQRLTTKRAALVDVDTTGNALYSAITAPIPDCGATPCTNKIGVVGVNTWAAGVLGAMANYGTSPGAVLVPGVNAFITNTVPVTLGANQSVNVAQFGGVSTSTGQVAVSVAPVTATNTALVTALRPDSPGIITLGPATVANSVPFTFSSQYPTNATTTTPTAVTASTTGTTAATAASLGATASVTNFVCGFDVTSDATALATGTAVLSGTISGSLSYLQTITAATNGTSQLTRSFTPCIPASGANVAITITSAAAGTGGNTIVNIWGYRL